MSIENQLFCPRKVTVQDLITHLNGRNVRVFVLREWESWARFNAITQGDIESGDIVCGIDEIAGGNPELVDVMERRDRRRIEESFQTDRIGSSLLIANPPELPTQEELDQIEEQLGADAQKIRKSAMTEYVVRTSAGRNKPSLFVQECVSITLAAVSGGLVAFNGEAWQHPTKDQPVLNRKRPYDFISQIDVELLKHEVVVDAQITDRRCPNCGKPCPTYRKTCKHCNFAVGRQ